MGREAVERWRKSLLGRPGASVVGVLVVGRSPAAFAVVAAAELAASALASVEPVEFRTAVGRPRTPGRHRRSFVHSY